MTSKNQLKGNDFCQFNRDFRGHLSKGKARFRVRVRVGLGLGVGLGVPKVTSCMLDSTCHLANNRTRTKISAKNIPIMLQP